MKSWSIRWRITTLTIGALLSAMVVLGVLMGHQLRDALFEDAVALARQVAWAEGRKVEHRFGELFTLVGSQARVVAVERATGRADRALTNGILRSAMEANPRLFSDYVGFDPNAFDGRDAEWVDQPGQDATGRYIPYFVRADGQLTLSKLGPPDGEAWYELPKQLGRDVVIEPYEIELNGKKTAMITVTTPIMDGEKAIGVVGIDYTLEDLNRDLADIKPLGGSVALISAKGVYASNPNAELVGKSAQGLPSVAMEAVRGGREYFELGDDGIAQLLVPLQLGGSAEAWALLVSFPMATPLARADQTIAWFAAAALVALVVVSILVAGTLRRLLKPLAGLENSMSALATGAGDLTAQLPVGSKDEIGRIGAAFNQLIRRLRDLVSEVKTECRDVAESAGALASRAARMANQVRVQTDSAGAVVAAMEEVTVAVHSIADTAKETERAGREMATEAKLLSESMNTTSSRIENGRVAARHLASVLDALEHRSDDINGILVVIAGIAGQTNMLALNAAIEAARAGEKGRGFAVVADEVRALAERTEEATRDITGLVGVIKDEIDAAVGKVSELVDDISNGAELTTDAALRADHIAKRLSVLVSQICDIAASTAEQSSAATEVAHHVERIRGASEEILGDVEHNLEETGNSREMANRLQVAVAQFKTG